MTLPKNSGSSSSTAQSPLGEFWAFAKDFQSLSAWVAKAAVAAPILDLVLNLGPPWPERVSVTTAVVLLQLLVLMCSFTFWRQGRESKTRIKKWLLRCSIAFGVVFFLVYLPLFAFFVVDAPDRWNRSISGWVLQPPIKEFVAAEEKEGRVWTAKKLIAYFVDATNDETAVWTATTVYTMRAVLLGIWGACFLLYAIAMSAFVALQYRRIG